MRNLILQKHFGNIAYIILRYDYFLEGVIDKVLKGHQSCINQIDIIFNNKIITKSRNSNAIIWNMDGSVDTILPDYDSYIAFINSISREQLPSQGGSRNRSSSIWKTDPRTNNLSKGHTNMVTCLDLYSDGRMVSGSLDDTCIVWKLNGEIDMILKGHTNAVDCITILPDGRIISGSSDATCIIWNEAGEIDTILKGHTGQIHCINILPNEQIVTGSSDGNIIVWDLNGNIDKICKGHSSNVLCITILPNGQIISGSYDNTCIIWK